MFRAWGSAPGSNCGACNRALKARFNPGDAVLSPKKPVSDVNRAFSAGVFLPCPLGRRPRLTVNVAPLALNTYVAVAGRPMAATFMRACRSRP
jgi:hypothetical protein